MAFGRDAAKAMQQKSAEQRAQRSCQDTERLGRVQRNVTLVARDTLEGGTAATRKEPCYIPTYLASGC
jgi:hypothetical protein